MKRSTRANDVHSGQIAFPGGSVDENENDLQAAIREVHEEIGFNLYNKSNYIYLGKLPLNVFAYFRKGKKVMMSVNLFLLDPNVKEEQLVLNKEEVSKIFWIPLSYFLYPLPGAIYYKELHRKPNNVLVLNKKLLKFIEYFAFKNFKYMKSCHLKLNGEELFGLTFYITMHMLRIMYLKNVETYKEYDTLIQLQEMLQLSSIQTFHHEPQNIIQTYFINKLYYNSRLKQFDQF